MKPEKLTPSRFRLWKPSFSGSILGVSKTACGKSRTKSGNKHFFVAINVTFGNQQLAGAWKEVKELGYLKTPNQNRERFGGYPQVSKHIVDNVKFRGLGCENHFPIFQQKKLHWDLGRYASKRLMDPPQNRWRNRQWRIDDSPVWSRKISPVFFWSCQTWWLKKPKTVVLGPSLFFFVFEGGWLDMKNNNNHDNNKKFKAPRKNQRHYHSTTTSARHLSPPTERVACV